MEAPAAFDVKRKAKEKGEKDKNEGDSQSSDAELSSYTQLQKILVHEDHSWGRLHSHIKVS